MNHPSREALYESNELSKNAQHSAALLASKVYYFLGEYDEALSFALGAGHAFQAESRAYGSEEYVETVVCEYQPSDLSLLVLNLRVWQPRRSIGILNLKQKNLPAKEK